MVPASRPIIIERYRNGVDVKDIGREFGVSSATIYRILREAGITRLRGPLNFGGDIRRRAMEVLRSHGWSLGAIGRAFKLSAELVRAILQS